MKLTPTEIMLLHAVAGMDFLRPCDPDGYLSTSYQEIEMFHKFGYVDVFGPTKTRAYVKNKRLDVYYAKITDAGIRELNYQIGIKKK